MKRPTDLKLLVKLLRYVESLSLGPKAPRTRLQRSLGTYSWSSEQHGTLSTDKIEKDIFSNKRVIINV